MGKLEIIRLYRTENVPDHLIQEVEDLIDELMKDLDKVLVGRDSGIVLSAFNRIHAMMVVHLITERGLMEAALTEAKGLIRNIEHVSGQKILPDEDDE